MGTQQALRDDAINYLHAHEVTDHETNFSIFGQVSNNTQPGDEEIHFRKLERMYLSAPVNNSLYKGITLYISNEKAELSLEVESKFFHAANAIHGSVYFKMLDDAAFFAVNSIVQDVFVYTVSFNIQLLRPVSAGIIKSTGEVKFKSTNLFIADSSLLDEHNKLIGRGSGNFMKSKIELTEKIGYA